MSVRMVPLKVEVTCPAMRRLSAPRDRARDKPRIQDLRVDADGINTPPEDCPYLLGSGNACHGPLSDGDDEDISRLNPGRLPGLRV